MRRNWNNVPGIWSCELAPVVDDDCLPSVELVIHFRSSGFYDPGSLSGWPEHRSEERVLDFADIILYLNGQRLTVPLGEETAQYLFDEYHELIDAVELEKPED